MYFFKKMFIRVKIYCFRNRVNGCLYSDFLIFSKGFDMRKVFSESLLNEF